MISMNSFLRAGRRSHRRFLLPSPERLEARALLATLVVTNTNDSGPGSLRQAIIDVDSQPPNSLISFDIAGDGAQTIRLSSPLPAVTNSVTIDGFTQPGAQPNTSATGDDAIRLVVLDGSAAGAGDGLTLAGGDSTVRGLVIGDFSGSGIVIESQGGDTVAGDAIGIDATGSQAFANLGFGVEVNAGSNTIGGTSLDARNLISGNVGDGIGLEQGSSSNTVAGNYIGTNAAGSEGLGNRLGVEVHDSQANVIGGQGAARNLISGNSGPGVFITGQGATQNDVTGNDIGTDVNGLPILWNGVGVLISDASNNTIGGPGLGEGNTVSGVNGDGIDIIGPGSSDNLVVGNNLGTTVSGLARQGGAMNGICIINAPNNQVGGVTAAAGNVILGFARSGVVITGSHATGNLVEGNTIGTDRHGTYTVGNGFNGVTISHGASNNVIGGTSPAAANVIAFNGTSGTGNGVAVTSGVGNVILSNLIYANTGGQIALNSTSSPTIPATEAPLVRSAFLNNGRLRIGGSVDASPGTRVLIQFFLSDPSRPRTPPKLLGNLTVQTNPRGQRHFKVAFRAIGSLGRLVTATATIPGNGTSTYSKGVSVIRP
jgi:hypothetical protein